MKNDNNSRPKKKAKTQPTYRHEVADGATSSFLGQPANDERAHYQPHDKFIKCVFKIKEIAIDFFTNHLVEKALSRCQLEKFELSNSEHQQPFQSKLFSDVVYHGKIKDQVYYIALEHQSSFDRKIIPRLLEYSAALMKEHIAQNQHGQAIVFPMCLYHESRHNSDLGDVREGSRKSMMERLFSSKNNVKRFSKFNSIKVVDLTVMTDEEIGKHGKAAIMEWILKDAPLSGDDFLRRVTQHLKHSCYRELASIADPDDFKLALYEYILSVYEGDKSPDELIDIMAKVLPQEKKLMRTAAEQLRQQGSHDRAVHIAEKMLIGGLDPDRVKCYTELSDEELAELSPVRTESTPPLCTFEEIQGTQLVQSIAATAQQIASGGEMNITASSNHGTGVIPTDHRSPRHMGKDR